MSDRKKSVECPICGKSWPKNAINAHVNSCLNVQEETGTNEESRKRETEECHIDSKPSKRFKAKESPVLDFAGSALESAGREENWCTGAVTGKSSKLEDAEPVIEFENSPATVSSIRGKVSSTTEASEHKHSIVMDERISEAQYKRNSTDGVGMHGHTRTRTSDQPTNLNENNVPTINFWSTQNAQSSKASPPLAEYMRPKRLEDYVGQDTALGKSTLFRNLLESHQIPSMILWGPPGCGKTTLAKIIAQRCKQTHNTRFTLLSATTAGIADVKEAIKVAKNEQKMFRRKTILFIDEIHRFNKLQQDSFLPHVEDGTVILIGATTENPSFQVNNALLSRCRVIVLEKLSVESVESILHRALETLDVHIRSLETDSDKPAKDGVISIETQAVTTLACLCDGDARIALNSLQTAVDSKRAPVDVVNKELGKESSTITVEDIKQGLQRSHIQYDRAGDEHYNMASALQKSIRGSNDNAAVYWATRMLEGGEDPLFVARRLVVCASEDIGMADPHALSIAVACFQACHLIGMPECAINIAHCVTYLSRAPKSNEAMAALGNIKKHLKEFEGPLPGVPLHLRNASTKLMKDLGYGKGYKYSHDYSAPVEQDYLPDSIKHINFYK